jgi:hemoglobin
MPSTLYDELGGETKVRELCDTFYDIMETDPAAKTIRDLHPDDMTHSREKFFMFLSGWLGGPQLYMNQYGHPRLRARHLPFPIGEKERDEWLYCMNKAMQTLGYSDLIRNQLLGAFFKTADFMRNKNESTP